VSTEPVLGDHGLALAPDAADVEIDVTRLRVALARLSRRLRRHELAGLTPTQLAALSTIGKTGPMRLGDLAAAEGIAPSTLTRLVTALEESGYVRRGADPSDARASTLTITAHGQDALERIRTENTLMLTASLELLTLEQRSALAAALPVLEQLAEAQGGQGAQGVPGAPGGSGAGPRPGPGSGPSRPGVVGSLPGLAPPFSEQFRQFRQAAGQLVAFPGHRGELLFQVDDAADGLQGDALVGHRDDLLDDPDLVAGVASLAARGPLRRDDLQFVDAAQERLLDREHLRDLADGVQRRVLVFER
jgi:DNA-binding MarR family transcriptional regulator